MAKAPRYENSAADKAADRRNAKKAGVTVKAWERSSADKREDAKGQKALNKRAAIKKRAKKATGRGR